MSENKISHNVCKVMEFKDAHYFQAMCSCCSEEHIQDFSISVETTSFEKNPLDSEITLELNTKVFSEEFVDSELRNNLADAMENGNYYAIAYAKIRLIFANFKSKLNLTWDLWTKGYVKANSYFIFRNSKAIDDYVFAINDAKKQCEEFLKSGK